MATLEKSSLHAQQADWYHERPVEEWQGKDYLLPGSLFTSSNARSDTVVIAGSGYTGVASLYPHLFAQALTRLGLDVFAIEYPGYGVSAGTDKGDPSKVKLSDQIQTFIDAGERVRRFTFGNKKKRWSHVAALAWGMGAGHVIRAQRAHPSLFDALIGLNGLYISKEVQIAVRGGVATYNAYLSDLSTKADHDLVDGFYGYPMDPETTERVTLDLLVNSAYRTPNVRVSFARELLALDVVGKDGIGLVGLEDTPMLFGHGTDNPLHPVESVRRVQAAYPGPSNLIEIKGAKHNDFMRFTDERFQVLMASVATWLKQKGDREQ